MAWSQVQREQLEKLLQSKAVNSSSAPVIPGTSIGNQQGVIRDNNVTGPLIRDGNVTGPLIRDENFPQGPPRHPDGRVDRNEYTTVKTKEGDIIQVPVIDNKKPQPGTELPTKEKSKDERWDVDDMIKIIDKSAESQKGIISDLLKQQFGYGSAKKLRDTIIDAPLIEAQLMSMQADREVENLKAVPKLTINPNMKPDNFNYTQLIHGGRA